MGDEQPSTVVTQEELEKIQAEFDDILKDLSKVRRKLKDLASRHGGRVLLRSTLPSMINQLVSHVEWAKPYTLTPPNVVFKHPWMTKAEFDNIELAKK